MDNTKIMDIIAYYLSKYDMDAIEKLGYSSRSEAFKQIGQCFGKNNNYLKRLRDEYDVVTSSHRNGQRNRPPRQRILDTAEHLKYFSFEQLSDMVFAFINNTRANTTFIAETQAKEYDANNLTEEELENIVNFKDNNADVKIIKTSVGRRIYNTSIVKQLKNLYSGKCQICGCEVFPNKDVDICEVHHIKYFSVSHNNDASNLIVVCPNHHRLIHKLNPTYDSKRKVFVFNDNKELKILLDYHLNEK